ncbi:MAG TPA: SURF1 family protein [Marmoricola sp.]|nr:SURF1 family protein [Marmoricola sp.]
MLAPLLRPKFWPGHLAMLVAVAIAVGLGVWQLDAWRIHRADAARNLTTKPPVALGTVMTGDSPFPGRSVGQPVSFTGRWTGGNIYVSDRYLHGTKGYWVVSSALVDGTQSAMPVVRGWSRGTDVPAPTGATAVTGWLQPTEGSGPPDPDPHDDVIPMMRIASLVEKVDADLYSGYVVAKTVSNPADGTLAPVQPPAQPGVSMWTAARNLFYAIEWWVFGGFAVFIWLRWCHDTLVGPPRQDSPDDVAAPADA